MGYDMESNCWLPADWFDPKHSPKNKYWLYCVRPGRLWWAQKGPLYVVCIYYMFAKQWSVLTGAAVCVRELLFPSKNPPWHCRSRHYMLCAGV